MRLAHVFRRRGCFKPKMWTVLKLPAAHCLVVCKAILCAAPWLMHCHRKQDWRMRKDAAQMSVIGCTYERLSLLAFPALCLQDVEQ